MPKYVFSCHDYWIDEWSIIFQYNLQTFSNFLSNFFSGSWNSVEHSRAAFGPVRETDEEDWLEDPEGLIRIMTTDPKSLTVL